jgi:branched-chain amino acid transport system substrate-binding protein
MHHLSTLTARVARLAAVATAAGAILAAGAAYAQQAMTQFVPVLTYRTGPLASIGEPWANGMVDYYKLVNERDGGINGVKIQFEECEFGYATDRGVECYERLKGKGPTGAAMFSPLSTGVTFALTEKAPVDKIPLLTMGYGRSESADGGAFAWNFPMLGTYWSACDVIIKDIERRAGGAAKVRGMKIALLYHDSPFGKEPISMLQELAKVHGFTLSTYPVSPPGVEQKSTWLQIRQARPDYIVMQTAGIMTSAAIREAIATGYPRDKMYGIWYAGSEQDVSAIGKDARGYRAVTLSGNSAGRFKVHEDVVKYVYAKGRGTGKFEDLGSTMYTRGLMNGMLTVEAIRRAQTRFGKKPMTGEQVRWGLENMALDQKALDAIGFGQFIRPSSVSCSDHEGSRWSRVHEWDGAKWKYASDWYEADAKLIKPMVRAAADKYAAQKSITRQNASDCRS